MAEEIPPGLKKRWEEFGELSRKCWMKVEEKDSKIPVEKRFEMFWECMKEGDPISPKEVERCKKAGIELAPHPICVLAETAKGLSHKEAAKKCLKEGRVHGISYLACKARLAGEL
ncbi:MAG: hypothetical protein ACTSX6_00420 [Candidatus Heimdallarchaeaceae archaeon]